MESFLGYLPLHQHIESIAKREMYRKWWAQIGLWAAFVKNIDFLDWILTKNWANTPQVLKNHSVYLKQPTSTKHPEEIFQL
jgi:hypothetical protein